MKPIAYSSGDYAAIRSENFKAYYGYEVTSEDGEWCFEARFEDEVITIPFSKLGTGDKFNCVENLMKGIAWLFMKYKLTL